MAKPLPVPDEAPQAIRSTPHVSQVRELLALYQQVLDTADDLSLMPMVLRRHGGRLHYLPRPKWLVRYFLVGHVRRSLADLSRRYSARAALEQITLGEEHDREAVREFQQSLPPDRQKFYLVLLIAVIVVVIRPIIYAAAPVITSVTGAGAQAFGLGGGLAWRPQRWDLGTMLKLQLHPGTPSSAEVRHLSQNISDTIGKIEEAVTPNVRSIDQGLTALLTAGPLQLTVLASGVALSTYVVLLPFGPAFRFKRMFFNLAPEPKGRHRSAVARWSVSQATGLYESEHRVFAELGARPPKEFPFDLAVSALAMALPLACCGLLLRVGVDLHQEHRATAHLVGGLVTLGICLLIPILVRLGWLCRTWQCRQVSRSAPYRPFEVGIRSGGAVARVENPIGWRLLFFLVFFLFATGMILTFGTTALVADVFVGTVYAFVFVSLPWWYRINRELRDLDRSYGVHETGIRPGYSVFIMAFGILFCAVLQLIAVFSLGRHIRRAQARAGQPITAWPPWILAFGSLLAPVLFAYLQSELNKIWKVEGQPLDPWPAESSPEVNRSTGTLPWLKAKRSTD